MNEFEQCIKRRNLVPFTPGADVIAREIRSAREDLADAALLLEHERFKRLTITSYYVMFHSARALVFQAGYSEKSHFCLAVAFRELYARSGEGRELAMGLERARMLRENADYLSEHDEAAARAAFTVATRFFDFAEKRVQVG